MGPRADLVVDRTAKRNAFTQEMWSQVPDLVSRACAAPGVRVLVVRSAQPGVFSAGADIGEYRANAGDVEWGLASRDRVSAALQAIRGAGMPVIAAVDGACIGGGLGIALAADLRLATERSTFALPPARLGLLFPFADLVQLVDVIGPAAARRLLFTGGAVDAPWALRAGLVDEVHPVQAVDDEVEQLCAQICAVAPGSLRGTKEMLRLVADGVRRPTERTEALERAALRGVEHVEGVTAFLQGRPAVFG